MADETACDRPRLLQIRDEFRALALVLEAREAREGKSPELTEAIETLRRNVASLSAVLDDAA